MKTSIATLARHIYYRTPVLKRLAIKNPHVMQMLGAIMGSDDPEFLSSIQKNPVFKLYQIRITLAENVHTPKELIIKLTRDRKESVRIAAVKSPALSEAELEEVQKRPFESLEVKAAIRENPAVVKLLEQAQASDNPAMLAVLAHKPFSCVRVEVAKNIHALASTLNMLSRDEIWTVAVAAAKNPKASWETAAVLLGRVEKKKIGSGTTEYCPDGVYNVAEEEFQYPYETFLLAQELLEKHNDHQQEILAEVERLNPGFHSYLAGMLESVELDRQELEAAKHLPLPVTWKDLYQEIVYREPCPAETSWGKDPFGRFIIGATVVVFGILGLHGLDLFTPDEYTLIGTTLGGGILAALLPDIHRYVACPTATFLQYLSRKARFAEDYQLASGLGEIGMDDKSYKRLKSIILRIKDPELADNILQKANLESLLFRHDEGKAVAAYLLAKHPETSEELLAELLAHPSLEVKKAVAENLRIRKMVQQARTSTSSEVLMELGRKPFPCIQATVAGNIHTPTALLEEFSESEYWMLKITAAANKNTPWEKVALVLSQIRPDTYLKTIPAEKWWGGIVCPLGDAGQPERKEDVKYYPEENLELARKILEPHATYREEILAKLKELAPLLHSKLS